MSITKKYDMYKDEIRKRNRDNLVKLAMGGSIICAVITLIGFFLRDYTQFTSEYSYFLFYMAFLYGFAIYAREHKIKHINAFYYSAVTPIMLGGILMGTFLDPTAPALTIMVLINVVMLFVIDKPARIFSYIVAVQIVFVVCCALTKSREVFLADIIDLLIYGCIAFGVNYFMLIMQIESVENYCMAKFESERDSLTRLYNRGCGEKKTRKLIDKNTAGSLVIVDIDNFKNINDTFGHQVGDEVICDISRILGDIFSPDDVIFRLGGDEFAVFAPALVEESKCKEHFEMLQKQAQKLKTSNEKCRSVGLSAGWAINKGGAADFEKMYSLSDKALYEAKNAGKQGLAIKTM